MRVGRSGQAARNLAAASFPRFNCQSANAPPPLFFCGAGTPSFIPSPLESRGDGAPSGAPVFRLAAFLLPRTRAPLGAPSRFRSSGLGRSHRPRVRASWDEARANPSPASSSRRGHNAPRSVSRASRERGYEPRPQAPHQPAVSRRSFEARRRISGACPIVAPSSRRLATTPSAEPGEREVARSMWRKCGIYS